MSTALDYLVDEEQLVRTYPAGRVCADPGCATILSVYNPDPLCGLHVGEAEGSEPVGMKRCSRCRHWWPRDQYRKDRAKRDGLYCMCKACTSERDRGIYVRGPERRAQLVEATRSRRSAERKGLRRDGKPDAIQRAARAAS